jgi:hypothetical protein
MIRISNTGEQVIKIPSLGTSLSENKKDRKTFTKRRINALLLVLIFLFSFVFSFVFLSFLNLLLNARGLYYASKNLNSVVASQDVGKIRNEVENIEVKFEGFKRAYAKLLWMDKIPYFGKFVNDGVHAINAGEEAILMSKEILEAIEPYAFVFESGQGGADAESAENTLEKFEFIISTLPILISKLDVVESRLKKIDEEIANINPQDYPANVLGFPVRKNVSDIIEIEKLALNLLVNGRPFLANLPFILGIDEERTYLLLFQNDKELRPTGGFLTAYTIAKVNKGKFEPIESNDIYDLDERYTPHIVAPQPIVNLLEFPYSISPYLRLRDMNWDPDFENSIELFLKEAESAGIKEIDGVIAVDTTLLVDVLDVIGGIEVDGYGEFSNEIVEICNCPQVIYELESFADVEGPIVWSENEPGTIVFAPENYENRKEIIGPLMNSILSNTFSQPVEKMPFLFKAFLNSLLGKHVLLYMVDEDVQKSVVDFGVGGKVGVGEDDYFYIVDANLGGRKSNLYVERYVDIFVNKVDGFYDKDVEITYVNPEPYDGWLNSVLPNWTRIYLPLDSQVESVFGFEGEFQEYIEHDKKVVAGYFQLRPKGVVKIDISFRVPVKNDSVYETFIQKQPGSANNFYTVNFEGKTKDFVLDKDTLLKFFF